MDHRRGYPRTISTIFLVDMLDDLFASFMLEIDVNIRRLLTLCGDEPFKEEIMFRWIDRRDPEDKADSGIGCGASALTQDALAVGEVDDVMDG